MIEKTPPVNSSIFTGLPVPSGSSRDDPSCTGTGCSRRGVALTEFVIIFPLLLLIFVFMIDFGRAYIVAKAIDNAAAQGAYRASTLSTAGLTNEQWAAAVEQTVRQSLEEHSWYEAQKLTVSVPIPSLSNGMVNSEGIRTISVETTYEATHLLTLPGLNPGYVIDRTVRMDQLR
ncbi:hypothetical protein GC170_15905 [bacterium]|nr:hypothetical protein [bacterium]